MLVHDCMLQSCEIPGIMHNMFLEYEQLLIKSIQCLIYEFVEPDYYDICTMMIVHALSKHNSCLLQIISRNTAAVVASVSNHQYVTS